MNLYSDIGNVNCLLYRMKNRNIDIDVSFCEIGETLTDFDILFIGGGQDNEMSIISNDFKRKAEQVKYSIENNKVVLAICGGYQLLGQYYQGKNEIIELSGILPFYTVSSNKRMVGNIVYDTVFGRVVGFENHSGKTYFDSNLMPLGRVVAGYGNNGDDKTEGLRYKNTFCTYAHGPVLPKNPAFADEIIKLATKQEVLPSLNDDIENLCHKSLVSRFT